MEEIWKDVIGMGGKYAISNQGNVISKNYRNTNKPRKLRTKRKNNYSRFKACINGCDIDILVHKAVAIHFIPNPENKPHVNHINGIKDDNRVCNLEWVTKSEDVLHRYHVLKKNAAKGKTGSNNKFSKSIEMICPTTNAVIKTWDSLSSIRDEGMKISNVWSCIKKHKGQKTAYNYKWKYKNQTNE